ncbi:MAG: hypothetical protein KOO63_07270, partial [Bacteroidales bacterium]|nr:hypothetical protein [Candidatus Latescibacterota bacterium]
RDLNDENRIVSTPDMQVKIGTINNKDNPSLYYSPYSVNVEEGLETREQSLLIEVENFERERSFRLMKRFVGRGEDFQQYREIQFFVRGDEELTRHDGDQVDFYMQLAYDSLNFYEIAVPLTPQRAGLWNWVNIKLSDLTDMKLDAQAGEDVVREITDAVDPSKVYVATLRGNPSLFQVKYLFSGLRNRSGVMIPRGQVWFNDLALGNVRKDIDHAERLSLSASFGNILTVGGSWQHSGPEFRSLGQKSGSGTSTNSYNLNVKTELNHIIPTARFKLPVTFRYNRADSKPKYLPQKDVEINDPAVQDSLKSVKNNYSLSVSLSRRGSKNPIMKNIFDNLKAGFSYTKNASFSPTLKDTSWAMSGNANYQVQFSRDRDLGLFKGIKWRYWLTSFSMKANGGRSVKRGYSFNGEEFVERPEGYSCAWDNEISTIYDPFESLKFSYRRAENRNLAIENKIYGVDMGRLTSFRQSLDMRYQPRGNIFILSEFNPVFEYKSSYEEDLKPGVRQGDDPEGTRDAFGKRDIGIDFDVDIGKYALSLGKLFGVLDKGEERTVSKLKRQRSAQNERKAEFRKQMEERMTTNKGGDKPEGEQTLLPDGQTQQQEQAGGERTLFEPESDREDPSGLGLKRPLVKPGSKEAPADTAAVDTLSAGSGIKKPDPKLFFKHLFRFISRFDAIKSSIDITRRNQYERLFDRADFAYQMGLSPFSGTEGAFGDEGASPQKQSSRMSVNFRSGVALTSRISANFKLNMSQRTEESDTRVTKTENMIWPDLNINWKGIESWPVFRKYIKTSDLNISYIRQTSKRLGEETDGFRLVPNWNFMWKNSLTSNLSVAYFKKTTIERNQEMWEKNWSVSTEFKYDIRGSKGFGLPLPFLSKKKLKFESNLTMTLNIIYSRAEKYNVPAVTSLSVSPRIAYTFSRNMSGNLTATYRRSAGGIYGYVNHEVGLHATAEFKF